MLEDSAKHFLVRSVCRFHKNQRFLGSQKSRIFEDNEGSRLDNFRSCLVQKRDEKI